MSRRHQNRNKYTKVPMSIPLIGQTTSEPLAMPPLEQDLQSFIQRGEIVQLGPRTGYPAVVFALITQTLREVQRTNLLLLEILRERNKADAVGETPPVESDTGQAVGADG